jgi:hypothetical protein
MIRTYEDYMEKPAVTYENPLRQEVHCEMVQLFRDAYTFVQDSADPQHRAPDELRKQIAIALIEMAAEAAVVFAQETEVMTADEAFKALENCRPSLQEQALNHVREMLMGKLSQPIGSREIN